jgi:hypothetical protein
VVQVAEILSLCNKTVIKGRKAKGTTKIGNEVNNKHAFEIMTLVLSKERRSR